jgi:N-acetylglucosamine-6-phosphate deacetylase
MARDRIDQPFALIQGRIILVDRIETGKAVVVNGGRIAGIVDPGALGPRMTLVDVGGRFIAPGLIDIHTHGAMGYTFNDPSADAYATIAQRQVQHGVTSALATIATAPLPRLVECLSFARRWLAEPADGAQILGVHLEGPYFSLAQKGAQDPASIRAPDDGTPDELLQFHDIIRIMSFAPELPGALALTARLAALGIVPAAGHSSAREQDMAAAMKAGLRHVIHIWSGQSSTVRDGPWRVPGLLEVSLAYEDLTVEMIADNRHLPPTLMKLAYKCIGPDRLSVVSDATSGAGLEEGAHFRMGNMEYLVQDGVGMMLDRTAFGGSTTLLNQMIPILTDKVGVPLVEAVRMASLNPARVIGVNGRKGSLEPGKDADITIFDDDFTPWRVLIGGHWAYVS